MDIRDEMIAWIIFTIAIFTIAATAVPMIP